MSCNDGPLARERLCTLAGIDDFEAARRDWVLEDWLSDVSDDFVDHCELCNQGGLCENYLIVSGQTGARLKVGSSCIRKFILFQGTWTQEESNSYFDRQERQRTATEEIRRRFPDLLVDPVPGASLDRFRRAVGKYFGITVHDLPKLNDVDWKELRRLLRNPEGEALNRLRWAIYKPGKFIIKRVKIRPTRPQEVTLSRARSKTVRTTLSRSEAYRNPADLVGDDDDEK